MLPELYPELLDTDLKANSYPPIILVRLMLMKYLRFSFYGRREGDYKWNNNDIASEVLIQDVFPENDTVIGKKPLIIISRGTVVPLDRGIDNNMLMMDMSKDTSTHVDLLSVPIQISCIAGNITVSEYLASIVYGTFKYFKKDLMMMGLVSLKGFRIDSPQPSRFHNSETKIDAMETNVSMQIMVQENWKLRWKTDAEMQEYFERTGIDMRGNKIPPVGYQDITITTQIEE